MDNLNALPGNKTLIVIISYNSCHLMQECINSIRSNLSEDSYKILVVDNASTDGVAEWLSEQPDIFFIKNETNIGFGPACNQAVAATEETEFKDYDIFLLNNDTRIFPNSLYSLKAALYGAVDIGAVGSISNYVGNKQLINHFFDSHEEYYEFGKKLNNDPNAPLIERVRLSGFALLIKRNVWRLINGFDEDFAPGYYEDDALCMEILRQGYRLLVVYNSYIYHAGSQSFRNTDYISLLKNHHRLFVQKYGFDISHYAFPDDMITDTIPFNPKDEFAVLQIGSGLGADLKAIRSVYKNCITVGLETNLALYEIAKGTDIVFSNIEDLTNAFEIPIFDLLIINKNFLADTSDSIKNAIVKICKKNAKLLVCNKKYINFPFEMIRFIIWDLDNTFWNGIISENEAILPQENIDLIVSLTDHGIINSFFSVNDEAAVINKLTSAGINDYFVLNHIGFGEKRLQIAETIHVIGLQPENVLFIDNNYQNIEEAKVYSPGLLTASSDIIPYLISYFKKLPPKDLDHDQLTHYRLLDKKGY